MKYQPIETAPKDGSLILIHSNVDDSYVVVYWYNMSYGEEGEEWVASFSMTKRGDRDDG